MHHYNNYYHISDILYFPFYTISLSCFYMWSMISGSGLTTRIDILKIFSNSNISIRNLIVYYMFLWLPKAFAIPV